MHVQGGGRGGHIKQGGVRMKGNVRVERESGNIFLLLIEGLKLICIRQRESKGQTIEREIKRE